MSKKRFAVLTSGGDAPGMNAAIRAVVREGLALGFDMLGIKRGYNGLIYKDIVNMDLRSVSDIIHRGGTILYTARCEEFKEEAGMQKAVATCKEFGIDGIVVIGGDGSYRGARDLSERHIPCIGIPGTIDNDIACSDYTIGFDTAMNTCVEMVDRLRDTSQSHERCSIVEVMGRHAGHLALQTGIAVGATAVIIEEEPYDLDTIIAKMRQTQLSGKKHFIIIVSEGVGNVHEMAKYIEKHTGIESRATILGHVQRGGNPTVRDRVVASEMGYAAVRLLDKGIGNRIIALKENSIVDFDIQEALAMKKGIDHNLMDIANAISI